MLFPFSVVLCFLFFIVEALQAINESDNGDDEEEGSCCPCGAENNQTMVWCDGNDNCLHKWFHYECVGLTPRTIPQGKWFCSGEGLMLLCCYLRLRQEVSF